MLPQNWEKLDSECAFPTAWKIQVQIVGTSVVNDGRRITF